MLLVSDTDPAPQRKLKGFGNYCVLPEKSSHDCLYLLHRVWLEQDSVHTMDLKTDQIQTVLLYRDRFQHKEYNKTVD